MENAVPGYRPIQVFFFMWDFFIRSIHECTFSNKDDNISSSYHLYKIMYHF